MSNDDGWHACLEDGFVWEWEPTVDPRSYPDECAALAACQGHFDGMILKALEAAE